jgi:hypothetical protein
VRQDRLPRESPSKKFSIPGINKFGVKYALCVRFADALEVGQQDALMVNPSPNQRFKFGTGSFWGHLTRTTVVLAAFVSILSSGMSAPPGAHVLVR